jgi:hypothetical protein
MGVLHIPVNRGYTIRVSLSAAVSGPGCVATTRELEAAFLCLLGFARLRVAAGGTRRAGCVLCIGSDGVGVL